MATIEIDFDVFKALTALRTSEVVTYNDVLRDLLALPSPDKLSTQPRPDPKDPAWLCKGVAFPAGTEFRATYKGRAATGRVVAGALHVNGQAYDSPSAAAVAVTGNPVNGWKFWECRRPGESNWVLIASLRPSH